MHEDHGWHENVGSVKLYRVTDILYERRMKIINVAIKHIVTAEVVTLEDYEHVHGSCLYVYILSTNSKTNKIIYVTFLSFTKFQKYITNKLVCNENY